jgi:hypothetical protein
MFKNPFVLPLFLLAAIGLAFAASVWADEDDEDEIELEEADIFIEWNSTDDDYGVHIFWDGDPWKRMKVIYEGEDDDDEKIVLDVKAKKSLKRQGLTEAFFESAEPTTDELSLAKFLRRFPEGEYEFEGRTNDGEEIEGEAEFTHTLPAPPENLCPEEDDEVSHEGFTVSFDEVTEDTEGNEIEIVFYEVVVEKEEGDILQVFSVILLPSGTGNMCVEVPEAFLEPDTEYKLEVIAEEESGNRTAAESGTFTTDSD